MKWILFIRLPLCVHISLLLYACVSVAHTHNTHSTFLYVHCRGGRLGRRARLMCFFCAIAQKDAVSFPNCKYVKSHDISLYHICNIHTHAYARIDMRRMSSEATETHYQHIDTHARTPHKHWHNNWVTVDLMVVVVVFAWNFSTLAIPTSCDRLADLMVAWRYANILQCTITT